MSGFSELPQKPVDFTRSVGSLAAFDDENVPMFDDILDSFCETSQWPVALLQYRKYDVGS